METLLAVIVGALIVALPSTVALKFITAEVTRARELSEQRAVAMQTYITELQNRLWSHSWGEFAQLQNGVVGPAEAASRVTNSFGEFRSEEAYGESAEDVAQSLLEQLGDYEGPVVG